MTDEDPMQAMLKWLCEKLIEAEVDENWVQKNQNVPLSVKGIDLDIAFVVLIPAREACILVPKLRNGGYVPFFEKII